MAKAVGDFALFQNLMQEMHDIWMSLFYLIEEHNRVGRRRKADRLLLGVIPETFALG